MGGDLASPTSPINHPQTEFSVVSQDWKPGVAFSKLSDIGMRRANNQDSLAALPAKNADRYHSRGHLFVVADGMGAHAAGELASRMATETIAMHYFRSLAGDPVDALRSAVLESNAEIHLDREIVGAAPLGVGPGRLNADGLSARAFGEKREAIGRAPAVYQEPVFID